MRMTAVWQTLIPETPSTEPIAGGLIPPSPSVTTAALNPSSNGDDDDRDGGGGGGGGVSTICDHIHHRHNHNNNTSNSNKGAAGGINRFTSVPCGNVWRFYNSRLQSRKKNENRRRVLLKSGLRNICQINVEEKSYRYWSDMFTTLVDARWRYTLFIFSLSYVLSWLGFAFIWWIILVAHNDITHFEEPGWRPCVEGVKSFASIFLFSLETQHTIGYGFHRMTSECPDAIIVLCLQSIAGVLIEALMVGVVFAKLSRPKKRSQTLVFSRQAVICQRDGQLYLMFRVGDMRRSHILEAHIRAQVITKRTTQEGEVLPIHQEEIKVGGYGEDEDRILLFWPTTIVHPIDSESPFYEMSASDLLKAKIEVMVVMEGVVESTGMTTQARTSYLPSEILWGHRFRNTTSFKSDPGYHLVDFDLFHAMGTFDENNSTMVNTLLKINFWAPRMTFPVETPLCSSQDLDHIRQLKSEGLTGREILASLTESSGNVGNGPTSPPTATSSPTVKTRPNGPPNGACYAVAESIETMTPPRQTSNHVLKEAIKMSTPSSVTKNNNNLNRRNSTINPNLPSIPRSLLASPIKAMGEPGAEFLDNSTDSDVDDNDENNDDDDDDEEDDDHGYVEHTSSSKNNRRASRKSHESREAMLRAHSNSSSSSITSESNV